MTEQEARDGYDRARRARNRAQDYADDARSDRNRKNSELESARSEKNNLDDRLDDLNHIIRFFNQTLTSQISTANTSARTANSSYCTAICCDGNEISNASLADAFYVESISGNGDTSLAYETCVGERNRLEQSIEDLEYEISRLNQQINDLNSDIRYYNNQANQHQGDMNYYKRFF